MQINQVMTSYTQPDFLQIWWRDISASLYQKCLILCSKILLNVLHNTSLTVLLPWQHTGFQISPILWMNEWMNVYLYTTHITYCLKAQSPQISHICGLYGRPPFWCANRLQNSRELKQTFLNHGRQPEVETSALRCVFHPFNSKSQVVNAKMRAL